MSDRPDLEAIEARLSTGWPMCSDCGIVQVDEDGCCGACGKDAVLPDTDKALDHAPADISALLIYARSLESVLAACDERIRTLVEAGDKADQDICAITDLVGLVGRGGERMLDAWIARWRAVAHPEREGTIP